MTISDSIPIQFWVNGQETYNEKQICGVYKACFCQPWLCDREIRLRITDDQSISLVLNILDVTDNILSSVDFTEVSDGVFDVAFTPSELSPSLCQKIRLSVVGYSVGEWIARTSAADNSWRGVAYGNGVFVAVASTGTDNRVMTSPDGITWTIRTSASNSSWRAVAFGNNVFVAVASGGQVMTSPDGITWTSQTGSVTSFYQSIAFGNGIFVAMGNSADCMTSPDGVTWTSRTCNSEIWQDIAFGNGIFVAVSQDAGGNLVQTSTNGITWTLRSTPLTNASITKIAFGNGLFIAICEHGTLRSSDGISWTLDTDVIFSSGIIGFGSGVFMAINNDIGVTNNAVAYSEDGLTWNFIDKPDSNAKNHITFGDSTFVAVGSEGTGNRVITLGFDEDTAHTDCIDIRETHDCLVEITYSNTTDFDGIDYESGSPTPEFTALIPAQFWKENNPQEQEDSVLSNGVIVTRRTEIQEKTLLEVGYVPNYLHKKIQKILMHNSVQIEDVNGDLTYWKKRDAYEAENLDRYPLKTGNVWLTKYNSVEKNTI